MRGLAKSLATVVSTGGLAAGLLGAAAAAGADTNDLGGSGWQVQSSATATASGAAISSPGFDAGSWLKVRNDDGDAPGTEIEALVQNGACPDVYQGENLKRCFGFSDTNGPVKVARFAVPWWWRTTFQAGRRATEQLIVNGVDGQADVFVDGHEVATQATVQGAFTRYTFDVARWVHPGANALAVRVHPNDPSKMFTLDNVDWMQIAPDNDTGIQFPVQLHSAGAVSVSDAHVVQRDAADMSTAALTVKATVHNAAATRRVAVVRARVAGPSGTPIVVRALTTLAAGASRQVVMTPARFPALTVSHPAVWWPTGMGAHPLYRLTVAASGARIRRHGRLSRLSAPDTESETFGIRTVTSRLVGASALAPSGVRQYLVNGVPFEFRGGGWSEDLLLHYSAADTARQVTLIHNLGLNGVRLEGHNMPADFYEQMDRAGILVDAGFQCCNAWQLQDSKLTSAHDLAVLGLSALTIGQNLRDHPSVLGYQWSDDEPTPAQEKVTLQNFAAADFDDPVVASAEYKSSPQLGPAGEKEGPYDWVPPSYWYDTSHYDPTDDSRTNVGGAWGFDSEASAGDTIPTLDSLRRFETPAALAQLWQDPTANQYHLNYETGLPDKDKNYGYAFGTPYDLDKAISARYGAPASLEQYVEEAQLQNYETQRAQFEAYLAHSHAASAPSTGVVYWQLNKGWPTLLWSLYNNDYDQPGSFYGAQEANRPLHAFYAYDTGQVGVANLGPATVSGLAVRARVYDVNGKLLSAGHSTPISLASQGVAGGLLTPTIPSPSTPQTYLVSLTLTRDGRPVDRSTYWLPTQTDQVDWPATIGLPQATMTRYADLTGLRSMGTGRVAVTADTRPAHGADGNDRVTVVHITNTGTGTLPAFFLRADVRRGSATGTPAGGDDQIPAALWSANDTTLFAGQSETLRVRWSSSALNGAAPVITVSGDNVPLVATPAG